MPAEVRISGLVLGSGTQPRIGVSDCAKAGNAQSSIAAAVIDHVDFITTPSFIRTAPEQRLPDDDRSCLFYFQLRDDCR